MYGSNISTVYSPAHKLKATGAEGWAYIYDGYTSTYTWDGVAGQTYLAGMSTPGGTITSVSTTSGSFTSGVHFIRYRYWNSRSGFPSPAGTQTSFTATAEKKVAVYGMTASSDPRCDEIVLEMTEAGGTTYYRAAYISNVTRTAVGSAYLLSVNDDTLAQQLTPYTNTQDHSRPFIGKTMAYHKGYMFSGPPVTHTTGSVSVTSGAISCAFTSGGIRTVFETMPYFIEFGNLPDTYTVDAVQATGESGVITVTEPVSARVLARHGYVLRPQYPRRVYVSQSLYPESWDVTRFANVLRGTSDSVVALVPYDQVLMVYGEHSMAVWQWDLDPLDVQDARINTIPSRRGAINQDCVVFYKGTLYAMDALGFHAFKGSTPIDLTPPVADMLSAVNWEESDKFHAHVDEVDELIVFFVVMAQDSYPKTALVFDTKVGRWSMHQYDYEVRSSASALDGYGRYRPLLGQTSGVATYGAIGYSDGNYRTDGSDTGTIVSGTTASEIHFNADRIAFAFPATKPYNATGNGIYWEDGKEGSTITSGVTATSGSGYLSVAPAFTSAPSVGDTVTFSRIWSIYKTKYFSATPSLRMRNTVLSVYFQPLPVQRYLYVRVFEEGTNAAKSDWTANTAVNGIEFVADDAFIRVDLSTADGVVHIPMQWEWKNSVQFEFSVKEANVALQLYRYQLTTEAEDDVHGY